MKDAKVTVTMVEVGRPFRVVVNGETGVISKWTAPKDIVASVPCCGKIQSRAISRISIHSCGSLCGCALGFVVGEALGLFVRQTEVVTKFLARLKWGSITKKFTQNGRVRLL